MCREFPVTHSRSKGILGKVLTFAGYVHHYKSLSCNLCYVLCLHRQSYGEDSLCFMLCYVLCLQTILWRKLWRRQCVFNALLCNVFTQTIQWRRQFVFNLILCTLFTQAILWRRQFVCVHSDADLVCVILCLASQPGHI